MTMSKNKKNISSINTPLVSSNNDVFTSPLSYFKNIRLAVFAIFLISSCIYIQTFNYEYVLDDTIVITDNNYVKKGFSGIWEIFTTESFQGYFGSQKNLVQGSRYRPLSIATFAIEHSLWGSNPAIAHIINALLYGITCVLLFLVLCLMFDKYKTRAWYFTIPFVASMLYALHPLHIEAVANIKGRDEIMAMMFSLGSLYFFLRSFEHKHLLYISISAFLLFVGLMAKENAITFLAIIPASAYFFSDYSIKNIALKTSILLGITLIYIGIRYSVIGFLLDSGTPIVDVMNNPFAEMKDGEKMPTILYTLGLYFKLSFFPHPLTHDYYPYHIPIMNWAKPGSLISLLLYIGLAIYSLIGIFKKWIPAYAILVYLAALSIVSNIFVNVGTFMNERFLFMASMGTALLTAYIAMEVLPQYFKNTGKYLGIACIVFSLGFYFYKDMVRIPAWRNALTLNKAAVHISKNSARSNSFMATALFNEYKTIMNEHAPEYKAKKEALLAEAYPYARQAKKILPQYKNANLMLAGIAAENYKMDRDQTNLLKEFSDIISYRPDVEFVIQYLEYLNTRSSDIEELLQFYYNIGFHTLYEKYNNPQWAIKYLELGLQADVNNKKLHQGLSICYEAIGNQEKANYHLNKL